MTNAPIITLGKDLSRVKPLSFDGPFNCALEVYKAVPKVCGRENVRWCSASYERAALLKGKDSVGNRIVCYAPTLGWV